MICPKCNIEMVKGFIPATRLALMFIPDGIDAPLTIFGRPKEAVLLTNTPVLSAKRAESYYCKACEIVVTPVSRVIKGNQ